VGSLSSRAGRRGQVASSNKAKQLLSVRIGRRKAA
jgi:hypothetical protein